MKTKDEVLQIIADALDINPEMLSSADKADEIEEWDSVGHLTILVALDKACGGKVSSISAFAEADSITKILDILVKNNLAKFD